MFELLMQLPLFQGLSVESLSSLVEKYPFHFLKFKDGDRILSAGDPTSHTRFVISGKVRLDMPFNNLSVVLSHTLAAPYVLGADWLFGMTTAYPYGVTAVGKCGILQLTKGDYVEMLRSDKVLLFNILNYLSLRAQRSATFMLDMQHGSVAERLALLLKTFTARTSTDVVLSFKQKDLCSLLSTQRNSLLSAMSALEQDELVVFTTNRLKIKDLQEFFHQTR